AKSAGTEGTDKLEGKLIAKEHRTTGRAERVRILLEGGRRLTVPLIVSSVANSYVLVCAFNKPFKFYQVLYALLGISQSFFTYLLGILLVLFAVRISANLHHDAIVKIFQALMSFFGKPKINEFPGLQPMGRIISILMDFVAAIDNSLPNMLSMRMFLLVLCMVFGSVILITALEHYFIIAAVIVMFGFGYFAAFYRSNALEMKRLDAMLRSILCTHLYGEIPRSIGDNKYYIDLEDRALFLTVTNQRWLAVRLDALGSILVFLIGIFSAVGIPGVSAAQIGLILTYAMSLTQMFAVSTRLSAEVENYMNSVERVVHYARGDAVPKEAAHESDPQHKPAAEWPAPGAIEFKDVTMAYRVRVNGISLKVRAGEKVCVVGRTGAGKSSLTLCLLRIVEYLGEIIVDECIEYRYSLSNIGKIGLTDLRSNIAIILQEVRTVRTALDPFSKYDDARLWDALQRSYLVETRLSTPIEYEQPAETENKHKLTLATVIETDGANLSVGERSLLSLARALVKDSRVVILDEATQFKDRTLICIALMEAGKIAEFDTPLNLFNRDESLNITFTDIEKAGIFYDDEDDME
ncbi:P-loop containing nucleoside triphosphate hydrolase protein, partial [Mycena epipterygia]